MVEPPAMPATWGNLLTEPLFGARIAGVADRIANHGDPVSNAGPQARSMTRDSTAAGRQTLTLPGVLHALATVDVEAFHGLRRHQRQPWYSFLVQLAVIAAEQAGWSAQQALAAGEAEWRVALRGLTGGRDEAWCLVVADLGQPAFLQPPVPEGSVDDTWGEIATADGVDLLVTAKKHDVKGATITQASPAQWAWALLACQTGDGFGGRDLYGIARMNGGLGSRPLIGHTATPDWSGRFRRDVALLQPQLDRVREAGPAQGDTALVWCLSWDGTAGLGIVDLHPCFIEICRRLRLRLTVGGIHACSHATRCARIDGKALKGMTGDPWTPVNKKEQKSLTLAKAGFTYDKVVDLLFSGAYAHGAAFPQRPGDGGVLMQGMTRGQGKTEGLHERWLPVPPPILSRRADEAERQRLDKLAQDRAADAGAVWAPLRRALLLLQQGAPDKPDWQAKTADPWKAVLNRCIDDAFFSQLWQAAGQAGDVAQAGWRTWLLAQARGVLERAIDATPLPGVRRYRAITAAEAQLQSWPKGK